MKKVIVIIMTILINISCEKNSKCVRIPQCIQTIIDQHKSDAAWEVGKIEEYTFQGKTVFAFQPDNRIIADGATVIYNRECAVICSVGGFGGPAVNLCNGENFFTNSVFIGIIWEKP